MKNRTKAKNRNKDKIKPKKGNVFKKAKERTDSKSPVTTIKNDVNLNASERKTRKKRSKNKNKVHNIGKHNLNKDTGNEDTKVNELKETTDKGVKKIKNAIRNNTQQSGNKSKAISANKSKMNIQRLEQMLANKQTERVKQKHHTKIQIEPVSLRDRMMAKLKTSRFRFLNETLYNNNSSESKKYFKEDPDAFTAYHEGYKQQVEQWPLNPLDVIISSLEKLAKDHVIADFGCGEARLAESVPHTVHSFDLVAVNERVKACDMAHTPLLMNSVNVVVFCLSLMGNNLSDYIIEANRVLKKDGILKIAEVESRFENVEDFVAALKKYGFVKTWQDLSHNLFYFMDFKKESNIESKKNKLPPISLKSCLYKKR